MVLLIVEYGKVCFAAFGAVEAWPFLDSLASVELPTSEMGEMGIVKLACTLTS